MRCAWMLRILPERVLSDRSRAQIGRHISDTLVQPKKRQRVKRLSFFVGWIVPGHAFHRGRIERVPARLRLLTVKNLDSIQIRLLSRCGSPCLPGRAGRSEPSEHLASSGCVLLIPYRMSECHRFAPVRHRKSESSSAPNGILRAESYSKLVE